MLLKFSLDHTLSLWCVSRFGYITQTFPSFLKWQVTKSSNKNQPIQKSPSSLTSLHTDSFHMQPSHLLLNWFYFHGQGAYKLSPMGLYHSYLKCTRTQCTYPGNIFWKSLQMLGFIIFNDLSWQLYFHDVVKFQFQRLTLSLKVRKYTSIW